MRYAIIHEGAVVNVIDYASAPTEPPPGFGEGYSAVASESAQIGWLYDGETFTDPSPPSYVAPRVITYTEFEDRFTDTEADAIAALSLQNPTIHRVVTRAAASNSIDLDSPKLALFMGALVQAGIINEARSAEILGE